MELSMLSTPMQMEMESQILLTQFSMEQLLANAPIVVTGTDTDNNGTADSFRQEQRKSTRMETELPIGKI